MPSGTDKVHTRVWSSLPQPPQLPLISCSLSAHLSSFVFSWLWLLLPWVSAFQRKDWPWRDPVSQLQCSFTSPRGLSNFSGAQVETGGGGHPSISFDICPCLVIQELLCTPRTCVYVFFYFWIWKYARRLSLGNILFHILVLEVQTGSHILNKPSLWKNHLKKIGIRNGSLKGQ